ncbi:NDP-hexose 2,3-dehydratase family protein [Pseudonocardia nematodicida]|uniref:NDP-hexose 2,3-dehydratase family protein n=1 Tax=Pseudonocardia nematodicida TaxID=1206997 RepID=A0ABV1K6P8_9PSEU
MSLALPASSDLRIARSASAGSGLTSDAEYRRWYDDCAQRNHTVVERVPLDDLDGWTVHRGTGNIGHVSGKFFTVEGLDVQYPAGPVPHWSQPIINQPEVGILGLLVREFDGVLHCLVQGKVEPGNCNGVQLSPTVQATRSNYTQVHKGRSVPYLEFFRDLDGRRVVADVRQSEQGAWFLQKRNRNMIVDVTGEPVPEPHEDFCWLTLAQVHALLAETDTVNMDLRTVLSCLPIAGPGAADLLGSGADPFTAAVARSCDSGATTRHEPAEILSWITDARTRHEIVATPVPLNQLERWVRRDGEISHEQGRHFRVVGIDVRAGGREVKRWAQPMFEPVGDGLAALLVKRIDGVLHALVHARVEPGLLDVVELAPTVQCTVDNYLPGPPERRPRFLDRVLAAGPEEVRFDTVLSEEGGRFQEARVRYLIVEEPETTPDGAHPDHRWLALHQLVGLLQHSHYVNVQARTLVACLHSLAV